MKDQIIEASQKHPKPAEARFGYGTAGVSWGLLYYTLEHGGVTACWEALKEMKGIGLMVRFGMASSSG